MKKQFIAAGFVLFSIALPLKAMAAASFSQLFVFGDSLSDTGNVFNLSSALGDPTQVLPPSPPYFQGRFSNDKIWVDYFGEEVGLTPTLFTVGTTTSTQGINFAIGGSSSGLGNALRPDLPLPGVLGQVGLFTQPLLTNNQKVDPNALYVLWGGAADYLFGNVTDVNQPVTNLSNAVGLLAQAGAKNIMVFNLPDLGINPLALSTVNPSAFTTLTTEHNTKLAASLSQLSSIPDINIIPVDVYSLFNRVSTNLGEFGFTNATAPCLVGNFSVCNNPDEFVFWDSVHPTTRTHKLVAEAALAAVGAKSVPEPSTALGMLALSIGAAGVLKRKQKHNYVGLRPFIQNN